MFHTTPAMADQSGDWKAIQAVLSENAVTVQEQKCQDEDFADDKVYFTETVITVDNSESQNYFLCDNMKENDVSAVQGISADEIKSEFNNRLLYCEDCRAYYEDYCAECEMLVHILNKTVLTSADNRLRKELPHDDILEIREYFGQFRIFASKIINVGVRFGPFVGLNMLERSLKIKGGKFVVNKNKSKYLNWMQYINPARNISEQNLQVFQYERSLYYESTRQIEEGDELLVYFGEEYEDSLYRNVEMNFIPTIKCVFKEAFACTLCCLGFSSKSYLSKHKTICRENTGTGFSIEELIQCPSCKIHLDPQEYIIHHKTYCSGKNYRKCILSASDNRVTQVNGRKTRPSLFYKCQQCRYRTKYKADLKNHINFHCEVKMFKYGVCGGRLKTKVLRGDVENTYVYTNTHTKEVHPCSQDEIQQFKCSLCAFRTKYRINLKMHIKSKHLKEFNYKCDLCDYKAILKSSLRRHIETRHLKEFKYKCGTCDFKTNWQSSLKNHIETRHSKEFKYKCGTCNYKVNRKSVLQMHIKTRHLKEFKYECDKCDYKANFKGSLKSHTETKHLQEFKYKCGECDYKANLKGSLMRHVEARHSNEFKYKCGTCDFETNLMFKLKAHIETKHFKEFKYTCDICDHRTNFKSDLKSHIEARHLKEFKYKCDMCNYKANRKSQLKTHIETKHSNEFKHKCDTCDYKTSLKSNLRRHADIRHSKEFKYKCDICDYSTNLPPSLKSHIETIHLQEFKYKCDTCSYETNLMSQLKRHAEAKHLKEFRYKCDLCDYRANRKDYLKTHIESKHLKEFKYECGTCDYRTNLKSHLNRHVKSRHLNVFN